MSACCELEAAMAKPTRIYTRTGDDGTTGLVGGGRVKKASARIEAYGTIDELSSAIGLARSYLYELRNAEPRARRLDEWLAWTQDLLFNLGSALATPPEAQKAGGPAITPRDITALERAIDEAQPDLEPLANFIHPGGSQAGSALHLARTICRRAERVLCTLRESVEEVSPDTIRYVNRLSDALFVWSRWINAALARPEHLWKPAAQPPDPM